MDTSASRVVFLVNAPGYGGTEQHSITLATDLHHRGERVLVVCPPGSPLLPLLANEGVPFRERPLGMPVGRVKGIVGTLNYFLNPLSRRRLARAVLELAAEEPSLFVCPFPREQLLVTPLAHYIGSPVIWGIHSPLAYAPHRLLLRRSWHRRATLAAATFTVSGELARRLTARGFPDERLLVLPNAIPAESILAPSERAPVPGRLVITARLTRTKGVQYAIAALPHLLRNHPEAHLVIVGSGRYERSLRWLSRRLKVANQVRFLGYHPAPRHVLATAHILLCPSIEQEGLPTSILEAYGAGVPVVASSIGGIPDIVSTGQTGLLVPPGNSVALAEAVGTLLADPVLARALGDRGQDVVRQGYTFDQVGGTFARLVESIARGGTVRSFDYVPASSHVMLPMVDEQTAVSRYSRADLASRTGDGA